MAVVIVHPEWGIYLGTCLGLGFWSKMDPAGQDAAVTFPSEEDANRHMDSWDEPLVERPRLEFHVVEPDKLQYSGKYASVAACRRAGLDGWKPNG